jgi:RimJ/RimL family protein N-acetyltransferase
MPPQVTLADKPTLTGERVLLRPVSVADLPGLVALVADAEVTRLTGSTAEPFERAALEQWYATRAAHDDRLDLAVVERATGEYAGEVVLNELDPRNRSCSLRIALLGAHADRGLGTEAIRLVLDHAFDAVGLNRVALEVYDFNPRARHVYEKVGFVHEGTRRQALSCDGAWIDAHVMAVLAHEWAKHRGVAGVGRRQPWP